LLSFEALESVLVTTIVAFGPRADSAAMRSEPSFTFVTPVYELVPVRMVRPVPVFVRAAEPLRLPDSVSWVPLPPMLESAVIVTLPASEAVPVELIRAPYVPLTPVPAIVTFSLPIALPNRSSAPPLSTTVPAEVLPSAVVVPVRTIAPAAAVIVPVIVLAPFRRNTGVSAEPPTTRRNVRPPAPLITPLKVCVSPQNSSITLAELTVTPPV